MTTTPAERMRQLRQRRSEQGITASDDLRAMMIDAACFRFWVREAAQNPSNMAMLIMSCTTEQEYRDAIMPCIIRGDMAIQKAKETP